MADPLLSLSNVGKTYGPISAAEEIDLAVAPGEFVTFLGPSGSGKTTTLMMVAGFVEASSGEIRLDGKPLNPLPAYKRDIGMVFQHYALFPHMTVAQNVSFPLEMRKLPKAERRRQVETVLALVGLEGFDQRYPKQLSGGQQQRVALARAMVFKPRLLLMDEPLGALDKKLREQMQIEIMHLHRNLGITVLYVTHDQEEALVMSDRIAVFNGGRIEQIGTPEALYETPATRFVADFIGQSNFLPGRIEGVAEGYGTLARAGDPTGRLAADLAPGTAAVLAVRPERTRVSAEPPSGRNQVSGQLTDLIYLGQSRKIVARLEDGTEMVALEQAGSPGQIALDDGQTVTLSWRVEDARVLRDG
ncbi:MAG: ABC transporter ATP-binding protein [Rhodospirillales bacterium]